MARIREVVRILFPSPAFFISPASFNALPKSRMIGTTTTSTEKSIYDRRNSRQKFCCRFQRSEIFFGQYIAINTEVRMPIGTPMITAPAVTYKLPMIIGKIPNSSLLGRHISPVMNFTNPISLIAGMPLAK